MRNNHQLLGSFGSDLFRCCVVVVKWEIVWSQSYCFPFFLRFYTVFTFSYSSTQSAAKFLNKYHSNSKNSKKYQAFKWIFLPQPINPLILLVSYKRWAKKQIPKLDIRPSPLCSVHHVYMQTVLLKYSSIPVFQLMYSNYLCSSTQCSQTDNHEDSFAQINFKNVPGCFFLYSVILKFINITFVGFQTSLKKKYIS